jgi:hypothetical protein
LAGTLGALQSKSFAAWKSGDGVFWTAFLSDKFVGWGPPGRLDKDGAMRALSGADCRIDSYRLSNEQVSRLTPNSRCNSFSACYHSPIAAGGNRGVASLHELTGFALAHDRVFH